MAEAPAGQSQDWSCWWQGIQQSVEDGVRASTKSLQETVAKLTESAAESDGEDLVEAPAVRDLLRGPLQPLARALPELVDLLNHVLRQREDVSSHIIDFLIGSDEEQKGSEAASQPVGLDAGDKRFMSAIRSSDAERLELIKCPLDSAQLPNGSLGSGWLQASKRCSESGETEIIVDGELGASMGDLTAAVIDVVLAVWQCVLWLATVDGAKGRQLVKVFRETFPVTFAFFERLIGVDKLKVDVERLETGNAWLCIGFPLDFESMEQHYPPVAKLLKSVYGAVVSIQHPESQKTLATLRKEERDVQLRVALRNGFPAWVSDDGQFEAIAWNGELSASITVESALRILGLSSVGISLPTFQFLGTLRPNELEFSCTRVGDLEEAMTETFYLPLVAPQGPLLRTGSTPGQYEVTCAEGFTQVSMRRSKQWDDKAERYVCNGALLLGHDQGDGWIRFELDKEWSAQRAMDDINRATWNAVESMTAAVLVDLPRLRQLLQEAFHVEIRHQPSEGEHWLFRLHAQLALPPFPPSAEAFSKFFAKSLRRQLQKLALVQLCRDFLEAVCGDLKNVTAEPSAASTSELSKPMSDFL